MTEIERIMASSYYTIVLVNRLGERVTRSAFALNAIEASLWVGPGEKTIGIFSQSDTKDWTVAEGPRNEVNPIESHS